MLTIRTAQLDILPGNIRANWALIEKEIALAKEEGADLLVLPEMCLTGYLIGDLWDQNAFLREAERYNDCLRKASRDIMIAWGNVAIDWTKTNDDGRPPKIQRRFSRKGWRIPLSGRTASSLCGESAAAQLPLFR